MFVILQHLTVMGQENREQRPPEILEVSYHYFLEIPPGLFYSYVPESSLRHRQGIFSYSHVQPCFLTWAWHIWPWITKVTLYKSLRSWFGSQYVKWHLDHEKLLWCSLHICSWWQQFGFPHIYGIRLVVCPITQESSCFARTNARWYRILLPKSEGVRATWRILVSHDQRLNFR